MSKELKISRELLKNQYSTMKVSEIAEYYGICLVKLYKILDECGIERKWDKKPKRASKKVVITD